MLLLGKPGRRPQEKLLPGQFPPGGGDAAQRQGGYIKRVGGWAQIILLFRILPVFSGEGMVKVCVLNCLFFEENMV